MSVDEALDQLRDGAGTQFDPDLVDVLVNALDKGATPD
jgi:HD-GYP domain-containing protein (c-di-GMP phosphodiesterase class II)